MVREMVREMVRDRQIDREREREKEREREREREREIYEVQLVSINLLHKYHFVTSILTDAAQKCIIIPCRSC